MPKTILEVEVNDPTFQEHVARYEAYRTSLSSLPESWAQAAAGTEGLAEITAEIDAQNAALNRQLAAHGRLATIGRTPSPAGPASQLPPQWWQAPLGPQTLARGGAFPSQPTAGATGAMDLGKSIGEGFATRVQEAADRVQGTTHGQGFARVMEELASRGEPAGVAALGTVGAGVGGLGGMGGPPPGGAGFGRPGAAPEGDWEGMAAAFATALGFLHKIEAEEKKIAAEQAKAAKLEEASQKKALKAVQDRRAELQRVVATLGHGTLELLKWSGISSLLGGVLGGLSLTDLAGHVTSLGRQAAAVNANPQDIQALNANLGNLLDVSATLENLATAQSDLTKSWAFSAMGLNPAGKSSSELLLEALPRMRELFIRGGETEQYASATGLTQFASMDQLRVLANTPPEVLQSRIAATREDEARWKQYWQTTVPNRGGGQETMLASWQDFQNQLRKAGTTIEMSFIGAMTKVTPYLGELASDVAGFVRNFVSGPEFGKLMADLRAGLGWLGQELTSGDLRTNIEQFADASLKVAGAMVSVAEALGLVHPVAKKPETLPEHLRDVAVSAGAGALAGAAVGAEFGPVGTGIGAAAGALVAAGQQVGKWVGLWGQGPPEPWLPAPLNTSTSASATNGPPLPPVPFSSPTSSALPPSTTAQGKAAAAGGGMFANLGLVGPQILGVVAGLFAESEGFKLNAYNPAGGGEGARGLAQWRGARLQEFRHVEGVDPLGASLAQQLDFIRFELTHAYRIGSQTFDYRRVLADLRSAGSYQDALGIWTREYERPGAAGAAIDEKAANAWIERNLHRLRQQAAAYTSHDAVVDLINHHRTAVNAERGKSITAKPHAGDPIRISVSVPPGSSASTAVNQVANQ